MMTFEAKDAAVWAARETLKNAQRAYRARPCSETEGAVRAANVTLAAAKDAPCERRLPVIFVDRVFVEHRCCEHAVQRANAAPYMMVTDCHVHGERRHGTAD